MSEPERDDPTEAPAFKKLVRRFLETPPQSQEELKVGKRRSSRASAKHQKDLPSVDQPPSGR